MRTEEELNLAIAKWLGLENPHIIGDLIVYEGTLNGKHWDNLGVSLFTESLDSCIDLIVPRLYAFCIQSFSKEHRKIHATVVPEKYTTLKGMKTFSFTDERNINPALTFCRAVEQAIDAKEK